MNTPARKRALVTGGSGDLGRAIALRLARDGLHVIVHANSRLAVAQEVVAQIEATGGSGEAVAFNVADREAAQTALAKLLEGGPVQVLVNNAGTHDDAAFPALSTAQWQGVIDVSLNGFFNVTQPLTMPMIRTRFGRIVNISSIASITGNRGQVNYAAAKGALNSATKALSLELASRGITVNAVAPGIIDSGMAEGTFDKDTIDRMVPMKRAGRADEVAALVSFLASAEAGYITGQIISINGGMA
ncbi:3-oxoacyl-ACP reductase FabG [Piscinibacter gummiphilus]|uniref:3-oxoacyl-ACP reductase FabG n=1 Tax=Piscinibacter gummiphilus TaxID=946333 RepID=A0ABZ0CVJ2_9BURK|nr:3-oxoacyl-ACP reductase FabG [Piscinibacter gummiphilus]WOB08987.1 3-oxoacyl-ACP reductase FabG [Piscinibacter gummiphilus]